MPIKRQAAAGRSCKQNSDDVELQEKSNIHTTVVYPKAALRSKNKKTIFFVSILASSNEIRNSGFRRRTHSWVQLTKKYSDAVSFHILRIRFTNQHRPEALSRAIAIRMSSLEKHPFIHVTTA